MLKDAAKDALGGRRGRHLRVVRRHSQGQPEPDRRGAGVGFRQGQADDQHSRLPADRRGDDRHDRLHDLASANCRNSTGSDVRRRSSARRSTTAATAGRSTSAASSPRASTTTARAAAGACTRSAARARPPTTPARRSNGTAAFRSRSSPGTAASAAPSRDFWDQGGFYRPLSAAAQDLGLRCSGGRRGGGARRSVRWTARRHLANRGEEKLTPEGGEP